MPLSAYRTEPEMYTWQDYDNDTHSEIEGNIPRPYGHAHFELSNLSRMEFVYGWGRSARTTKEREDHFAWIVEGLKTTRVDLEGVSSSTSLKPDRFIAVQGSGEFPELKGQVFSLGASSFLAGGCVTASIFAGVFDVISPYYFLSLAFPLAGVSIANIIRALGRSD